MIHKIKRLFTGPAKPEPKVELRTMLRASEIKSDFIPIWDDEKLPLSDEERPYSKADLELIHRYMSKILYNRAKELSSTEIRYAVHVMDKLMGQFKDQPKNKVDNIMKLVFNVRAKEATAVGFGSSDTVLPEKKDLIEKSTALLKEIENL